MKAVVSAMASVVPEGNGIECLNYHFYEAKPVVGALSDSFYQVDHLVSELLEQLDQSSTASLGATHNLILECSNAAELVALPELENTEVVSSFVIAIERALLLAEKGNRVRVFLVNIESSLPESILALEDGKSFETEHFVFGKAYSEHERVPQRSHYAMAVQFEARQASEQFYYANIEDFLLSDSFKAHSDIAYMEVAGESLSPAVLKDYLTVSESINKTCALGSSAICFSYQEPHLDCLSFIKSVLQCYHRYLAGLSVWKTPVENEWESQPFYFPEQSRFWFTDAPELSRNSLILFKDNSVMRLSDAGLPLDRTNEYFAYAAPHLIPLAGESLKEFEIALVKVEQALDDCFSNIQLRRFAKHCYENLLNQEDELEFKPYRAVLLAEDKQSLFHEISLLREGIASVFSNIDGDKKEIKTPKGSYFTLEPLGEEGKVAFVFPGLGSSYIGLGQKIFQLFPSIFKESFRFTNNVGKELQEQQLYPRTVNALGFKERRQLDMEMVMNLKDLGKTDTTYSCICSHVMTDVFKLHPDMAFGYSMGEANMVTALDVWKKPTDLEERFKNSDIFKEKLYGQMSTVKAAWGLEENPAWATFTLKASKDEVKEKIQSLHLNRVYLTLINTDDNIVIAGEAESCMKLIGALGVRAIPMGFVPAIHCDITAQEYEGIAQLYSLETHTHCATKLYSSSCYLPVPVRQKAVAYAIAKCFCEPVDFPRLVDKVYHDGARIFLEAGAGRTCSTWIDKILQGKKHVVVPLNAKGTEDSLTFARVMAKLFCHKVDVNLSPLYANVM